MIVFRKARTSAQTLNDLNAYISGLGDEPVKWLAREVRRWGEFSYDELERAIEDGRLDELIDWQGRYSDVINRVLAPQWAAAFAAAAQKVTRGKIIFTDSDDDVRAWLKTRGGELISLLSDESKRAIANVILHAQEHLMNPRKIAQQIRPLIGLNTAQAEANFKYRMKIYQRYLERGASETVAARQADKAALKYAATQHRFRAETITHTELAFAYNQGAHAGVMRSIGLNLMGRCAMVWTTAGTNRVCGRCMALKDTIVGYTDESGVTLPPLHPRCRCSIAYREVGDKPQPNKPRENTGNETAQGSFHRPTMNGGVFAHLKVPMQLRAVKQICRIYGVDISGLRIKIQRSEEWLTAKYKYAGMTDYYNVGRIDLTPHAFADEEELLRTIIHESCHVKQLKKYGRKYAQEHIMQMEKVAERYENFFLQIVKRRRQNGS